MAPSPPVYLCRALVKRRQAGRTRFELLVPELRAARGGGGPARRERLRQEHPARPARPGAQARWSRDLQFPPGASGPTDLLQLWERRDLDALGWLRGAHIGYVLQTGGLLPFLTARENIALSCRLLATDPGGLIERLAERLGIGAQLDKHPGQLSVGERQRVAIARALAHRPTVLLADEPTASVDPVNAAAILELLLELVRQAGVTAVIASHDWHTERLPGVQVLGHRIERDGETTRSLFWS